MKLSQALREVARLHAEEPGHWTFHYGICAAVCRISQHADESDWLYEACYYTVTTELDFKSWLADPGDWSARPWMCLILAEYLEESGR